MTTGLMPRAMQLPGTFVLVSDGRLASAREVRRWREMLGPTCLAVRSCTS